MLGTDTESFRDVKTEYVVVQHAQRILYKQETEVDSHSWDILHEGGIWTDSTTSCLNTTKVFKCKALNSATKAVKRSTPDLVLIAFKCHIFHKRSLWSQGFKFVARLYHMPTSHFTRLSNKHCLMMSWLEFLVYICRRMQTYDGDRLPIATPKYAHYTKIDKCSLTAFLLESS